MSTAEPLSECDVPQRSQQSSGVLNFILSKLGRPSRNGAKSGPASSGLSSGGMPDSPSSKQEEDGLGTAEHTRDMDLFDEEVQSPPKPAVVPDSFDFAGRRGRRGSAGVVPQSAPGKVGDASQEDAFLPVGHRSASDSGQWDFRRREARRNSRSAREWVRDSNVEAPASDWSKDLAKYDPEASLPAVALGGSSAHLVPTHFEEDGMRFRRRSRSAKDLAAAARESLSEEEQQPRQRASLEASGSHGSKRSSFEAGLPQNLKAAAAGFSPRVSAEKIRRQGNTSSMSDFLPSELIQRSRLFNSPSNQP